MNKTMSGMVLTGHGGPEMLEWRSDLPMPVAGAGEVLIRVAACGLNNTDVNTRIGWYAQSGVTGEGDESWGGTPLEFPRIQGADVVGQVVSTGSNTPASLIGRRVMVDPWLRDPDDPAGLETARFLGSECDGGFAQFVRVPANAVHPVESSLSDEELATFATSYITAENMLDRAGVGSEDTVLITGASGGVGSALIQLATRRGARTMAISSAGKIGPVRSVGPDTVLNRDDADFLADLRAEAGSVGITVIADVVGGNSWPVLIGSLARGGRYVCSGAVGGYSVELDLRILYLNDLSFLGASIVPSGTFANLVGYVERGEIRPLLAAVHPLRDLAAAQRQFLARNHLGNIVVKP